MQKYLKITLVAVLFLAFTQYIISGLIESTISISPRILSIMFGSLLFVFLAITSDFLIKDSEQDQNSKDKSFTLASIIMFLLGINALLVPLIENEMKSKVAIIFFALSFILSTAYNAYSQLKSFVANIRKTSYKNS